MMRDDITASILSALALAEAESNPAFSHDALASLIPVRFFNHERFSRALEQLMKDGIVREQGGAYALASHERAFDAREEKRRDSARKMARNKIPLFFLQMVPFIRAAAVTGSVAMNNATRASDVDIFCIAERRRLWTARAGALALAALFLRRRDNAISGEKLCFNYFLARGAEAPVQNIASAHMFARAIPLFDDPVFSEFFTINGWIKKYLHPVKRQPILRRTAPFSLIARLLSFVLSGATGDRIERWLKAWQVRRLERKIEKGSDVSHLVLRDDAILLHYPESKNKEVMDRYERRMRALGIS